VKIRFRENESTKVIMILVEALIWYNESATLAFPFTACVVPASAEERASGEDPCVSEVGDAGTCCVTTPALSSGSVRDPVIVDPVIGIGSVIRVGLDP